MACTIWQVYIPSSLLDAFLTETVSGWVWLVRYLALFAIGLPRKVQKILSGRGDMFTTHVRVASSPSLTMVLLGVSRKSAEDIMFNVRVSLVVLDEQVYSPLSSGTVDQS